MTSPNGPQEDAEDMARLLREVRAMKGVSVAELADRSGVRPSDVLEFEAGRVIPAEPPFRAYMRALGFAA
ncbi:helix-turn-helix domain-containing protein [Pseudonocardia acaciae]|uniref:helix-turn-helix domain-containing protein n=1 Tax=Pseudonocardia acaciae TaxID=551276 RepID=UPI00048E1425|nr:helix-turn-helix transcriptional regulator [Pseudonocardia acaciae]